MTVKVDPKQADHGEPILVTVDPRALDCPLCFQTLRPPVFQVSPIASTADHSTRVNDSWLITLLILF